MDIAPRAEPATTAVLGDVTGARVAARSSASVPAGTLPTVPTQPSGAPRPVPTIGDPVLGEPMAFPTDRTSELADRVEPAAPVTRFPPGVRSKLGAYVYLLVDPRTGRSFFVGRGTGDRCHRHVETARATPEGTARSGKFTALDRIREAEVDGRPVRVDILRYGLTPAEARLVEASVCDALGLGQETRLGSRRRPAVELGAELARRARFKRSHPVVLLRVGAHGADTTYERARHGWRIGQRWVDATSPRSPRWAVVVAGDLVDAVYRIDSWEPSPATDARPGAGRWSFTGAPDDELGARYVGRSVAGYLGGGTPAPVTYVWCGPHWVNTAQ
jgi:hypothetical protein